MLLSVSVFRVQAVFLIEKYLHRVQCSRNKITEDDVLMSRGVPTAKSRRAGLAGDGLVVQAPRSQPDLLVGGLVLEVLEILEF